MNGFETKLTLLSDMLKKKHEILLQILTITENQKSIFIHESESAAEDLAVLRDMLRQMNDEKQRLIDEHLNSDRLFQRVFSEISDEFESRAQDYKSIVEGMQAMIAEVIKLDESIRVQEEKNRRVFEAEINSLKATKEAEFKNVNNVSKEAEFKNVKNVSKEADVQNASNEANILKTSKEADFPKASKEYILKQYEKNNEHIDV